MCRSSAGAKLSFPAGLRVRCGCVAGALRVRCGRIEIDDSSMILAHLAGKLELNQRKIKVLGLWGPWCPLGPPWESHGSSGGGSIGPHGPQPGAPWGPWAPLPLPPKYPTTAAPPAYSLDQGALLRCCPAIRPAPSPSIPLAPPRFPSLIPNPQDRRLAAPPLGRPPPPLSRRLAAWPGVAGGLRVRCGCAAVA